MFLLVTNFPVKNPYGRNTFKQRYFDRIFAGCFSVYSVNVFIPCSSPQCLHKQLFQIFLQDFRISQPVDSFTGFLYGILYCKDDVSALLLQKTRWDLFYLFWTQSVLRKSSFKKVTCQPEHKRSQNPLRFSSKFLQPSRPSRTRGHVDDLT